MQYFTDWHDYLRIVVCLVSIYSIALLVRRYRRNHKKWNEKTLDYWYAFFMWCLAGLVTTIQGLYLDRPFTPGTVFITAAVLVTGKGLQKKGSWGGDS